MSLGKISQVVGPVVDVAFAAGDKLPEINNALVVYKNDQQKSKRIVLEVALELGDGVVRTIAMESTDGLTRGMEVLDTGRPISFLSEKKPLDVSLTSLEIPLTWKQPFAEDAPREPSTKKLHHFDELSTSEEILETGIKVIDLLAPYLERWESRTLWWCRSWEDRLDSRIDPQHCPRARWDFRIYRCWGTDS